MLGEGELQREGRRILRKLGVAEAALLRMEDGGYAVARRPESAHLSRTRVTAEIVAALRTRDWIRPRGTVPESFVLSDAGTGWLLRMQADGDRFAAQHQLRVSRRIIEGGVERTVTANEGESPLGWLRHRRLIDAVQLEAGERLRRDFTLAQLAPRMGVDLSAPVVLGRRGAKHSEMLSDTVLAAKQRFARALSFVGPGLSDLLFDVCCHLVGLEEAERAMGWPRRAGKVVLQLALDRLALHYGMHARARGPMRSWQMEQV